MKYDSYRLRLERDGRIRLITRGGYNWTGRYYWIVEAARKMRQKRFVLDGEAVVLGVDGSSDLNAVHLRKHDHEVQSVPSTSLPKAATVCGSRRCISARAIWNAYLRGDRKVSSSIRSSEARSDLTFSSPHAGWG